MSLLVPGLGRNMITYGLGGDATMASERHKRATLIIDRTCGGAVTVCRRAGG